MNFKKALFCNFLFLLIIPSPVWAQQEADSLKSRLEKLEKRLASLESAELVQSMCQRSLVIPGYHANLKGLLAKQAYDFWRNNEQDKLVSHVNVYAALYYANKYLGFDSLNHRYFNQIIGHNESVISIQFGTSPDYFYSAGSDGRVLRWNLNDPKQLPVELYSGNHLIRSIDISADGQWIMVVTKEQGIKLISTRQSPIEQLPLIHDETFAQAAIFLPGTNKGYPTYLTVDEAGQLRVRGFQMDSLVGKSQSKVLSIEFNPKDTALYTGTDDGYFSVWDKIEERQFFIRENYAIRSMAISPDMRYLALGREKGDAILWDLQKEKEVRVISGHQSAITDIDFKHDGKQMLTASRDGTVRIWDLTEPRKLPLILDDHDNWVMAAAFSPDGSQVVSGARDNIIRTWPIQMEVLANRICEQVGRNLTEEEWKQYVGAQFPYAPTCSAEQ